MKCPYCNVDEHCCVPNVVYLNAESYGGGIKSFRCKSCNQIVSACIIVRVGVADAHTVPEGTESDF